MSEELIEESKLITFLQGQPTIELSQDGFFVWTECIDCGVNVCVDEDGCCSCGRDALRFGNVGKST